MKWRGGCWKFLETGYCCHAARFACEGQLLACGQKAPQDRGGRVRTRSNYNRQLKDGIRALCQHIAERWIDSPKSVGACAKRSKNANEKDLKRVAKCTHQLSAANNVLHPTKGLNGCNRDELKAHHERAAEAAKAAPECAHHPKQREGEGSWEELLKKLVAPKKTCQPLQ